MFLGSEVGMEHRFTVTPAPLMDRPGLGQTVC